MTENTRHEAPDVAELRDQIAGTIHRRICEHSREDCIENRGNCERATDSAMPLVSTALDEGNAMARLLADALNDAIRTLRELAEKAGVRGPGQPPGCGRTYPCCDCCLVKGQQHTLPCPICHPASANALRAELAHMREARDNARAEVERLTALWEGVREQVANGALCPMCCTGMTRRTVGMVCQLCGTDYGRADA